MRFFLFFALAATACTPIDVVTRTESVPLRSRTVQRRLGIEKTFLSAVVRNDAVLVRVDIGDRCEEVRHTEVVDTKITTRSARTPTVFIVNGIFGAVSAGVGVYFMATAASRPRYDDQYSRGALSSEGSYALGSAGLAGAVAFAIPMIVDGAQARDTVETSPPRDEVKQLREVDCGSGHPAQRAEVVLHDGNRELARQRTDDDGHVELKLDTMPGLGEVLPDHAGELLVSVGTDDQPIDVSETFAYADARKTLQRKQEEERQREAATEEAKLADQQRARAALTKALDEDHDPMAAERLLGEIARDLPAETRDELTQRVLRLKRNAITKGQFVLKVLDRAREMFVAKDIDALTEPVRTGEIAEHLSAGTAVFVAATAGAWSGVTREKSSHAATWADIVGWIPLAQLVTRAQFDALRAQEEREKRRREERERQQMALEERRRLTRERQAGGGRAKKQKTTDTAALRLSDGLYHFERSAVLEEACPMDGVSHASMSGYTFKLDGSSLSVELPMGAPQLRVNSNADGVLNASMNDHGATVVLAVEYDRQGNFVGKLILCGGCPLVYGVAGSSGKAF